MHRSHIRKTLFVLACLSSAWSLNTVAADTSKQPTTPTPQQNQVRRRINPISHSTVITAIEQKAFVERVGAMCHAGGQRNMSTFVFSMMPPLQLPPAIVRTETVPENGWSMLSGSSSAFSPAIATATAASLPIVAANTQASKPING